LAILSLIATAMSRGESRPTALGRCIVRARDQGGRGYFSQTHTWRLQVGPLQPLPLQPT
jgi:hypothetical protein